jgi:hypothetical protein
MCYALPAGSVAFVLSWLRTASYLCWVLRVKAASSSAIRGTPQAGSRICPACEYCQLCCSSYQHGKRCQ